MKFSEIINISNSSNSFYSSSPDIVFARSTRSLYVIWTKSTGIFGTWEQIMKHKENKSESIVYRISKDMGKTFGAVTTFYNFKEPTGIGGPYVASSAPKHGGNSVFLTWVDKTNPKKFDVYFSRNSDDGSRFEEPLIVSDDETGICSSSKSSDLQRFVEGKEKTYDTIRPSIASASDDDICVMWAEMTTRRVAGVVKANDVPRYEISSRIFFKVSADGGRTFGRKINILNMETSSSSPQPFLATSLIASGDNVYIIIYPLGAESENSSVRLFRSADKGLTFEEKKFLNGKILQSPRVRSAAAHVAPAQADSLYLMLALGAKGMRIPTNLKYFIVKSTDAGNSFSDPVQVADKIPGLLHSSFSVSNNGNNVYVAYADPGASIDSMFEEIEGDITDPQELIEELEDEDTAGFILVRSSTDGGNNFNEPIRLKDSNDIGPVLSMMTNIVLLPFGDNGVCVLKTRYNSTDNKADSEVLLWKSANAGQSFEGPIKINGEITNSNDPNGVVLENHEDDYKQQNGTISGDSDSDLTALCLVWGARNVDNGNEDVYFRRLRI